MGCDIHAYVEVKELDRWWLKTEPNIWRDYELFGLLAGVRLPSPDSAKPKGIPEDRAFMTEWAYTLRIGPEGGDGYVTQKAADQYLSCGLSEWLGDNTITHPDWHTPSWMTAQELRRVQEILARRNSESVDLMAIISYMETYEAQVMETRLVFWFDS